MPANVADLQSEVNNYWDRGLTGMAIDPAFTSNGFVYLFYPYDIDGTDATGPTTLARITRITLSGNATWCLARRRSSSGR